MRFKSITRRERRNGDSYSLNFTIDPDDGDVWDQLSKALPTFGAALEGRDMVAEGEAVVELVATLDRKLTAVAVALGVDRKDALSVDLAHKVTGLKRRVAAGEAVATQARRDLNDLHTKYNCLLEKLYQARRDARDAQGGSAPEAGEVSISRADS